MKIISNIILATIAAIAVSGLSACSTPQGKSAPEAAAPAASPAAAPPAPVVSRG